MFKRNGVINMGKERYSILFSSMTGNTKELADAIREILPEETLDYLAYVKMQIRSQKYSISASGQTKELLTKRQPHC